MVFGIFKKKQPVVVEQYAPIASLVKDLEMPLSEEDKEKLRKARALVVGCGALGASVALNMAAAGVGTIGLVDNGLITEKDVERQPIFRKSDVGKRKCLITGNRIKEFAPEVSVVPSTARMRYDTIQNMAKTSELIIDCSDNEATHFLIGDFCALNNKKHVFAHTSGDKGRIIFFDAASGPCLRCLYRDKGIECKRFDDVMLNPMISSVVSQVTKILLGKETPGKLLTITSSNAPVEQTVYKNENCELCGKNPTIKQLTDYEEWLGVRPKPESAAIVLDGKIGKAEEPAGTTEPSEHGFLGKPAESTEEYAPFSSKSSLEITPEEVKSKIVSGDEVMLIDVREQWEHDLAKLEGANLIPLGELSENLGRIPKDKFIVMHCHTGNRSMYATKLLRENGFSHVYNMKGGIEEWSQKIDSSVPRY